MNEEAEKREAKREKMKKNANRFSQSPISKKSSDDDIFDIKKKSLKKNASLLFRSQEGITLVAQKGLQKYHQAFLSKLWKAEEEKSKKKSIEHR